MPLRGDRAAAPAGRPLRGDQRTNYKGRVTARASIALLDRLRTDLPFDETRKYVVKVSGYRKLFTSPVSSAPAVAGAAAAIPAAQSPKGGTPGNRGGGSSARILILLMPAPPVVPSRMDTATWLALSAIALGWFGMATLVGTFGPVRQIMHFYDFAAVLHDPTWLVHGIRPPHSLEVRAFGTLSVLVLLAPMGAHRLGTRSAWLLYAAPLFLMMVMGTALYIKTSQPFFTASSAAGSIGAFVAQLSNGMIGRVSDTIARHISVGAGGYLAFAAAGYLTWKGASGYHAALLHRQAVR